MANEVDQPKNAQDIQAALAHAEKISSVGYRMWGLHMGDRTVLTGYSTPEQRDQAWETAAQENPEFANTIRGFKRIKKLQQQYITRHGTMLPFMQAQVRFIRIEPWTAREVLGTLFLYRAYMSPAAQEGFVDPSLEAQRMRHELGVPDDIDLRDHTAPKHNVGRIFEHILRGNLKLESTFEQEARSASHATELEDPDEAEWQRIITPYLERLVEEGKQAEEELFRGAEDQ